MGRPRRYHVLTGLGRLRQALQLSQPEMAACLDVTATHYCSCERARGGVGKKMALRALRRWRSELEAAGITLEQLIAGQ